MNVIPGKLPTVGLLIAVFLLSTLVAVAGAGEQPSSLLQPVEERPLNLFPTTLPTTLGPTREASGEREMPIGTESKKHPPASLSRRIIERMLLIGTSSYGMVNPDAYEQRPGEPPPTRSR
jgi:hypothetical protein